MTESRQPTEARWPVLSCQGVAKSFASAAGRIEVLRQVDLQVPVGASLSIRGESGSGKSTLLNVLSGLESRDRGEVFWEGKTVGRDRVGKAPIESVRGRFLGFVFQAYYLMPELNALENILMGARIAGSMRETAKRRAMALLARVGLDERAKQLPTQMSGGERQRVALARALINRPKIVLADEPTGNLDERTGEGVMALLLDLCREEQSSLILVTHNPLFAARTNRQYFLHEGVLEDRSAASAESAG